MVFNDQSYTNIKADNRTIKKINDIEHLVNGFNVENRLPIFKYGNQSTYFGYSVAEHIVGEHIADPSNTKWILVGVPRGKNLQPDTIRSGALYKCPITEESSDCEQIVTDGRETGDDSGRTKPPNKNKEIKEDQWLGVTVQSQGLGSMILVCAHRYIIKDGENQHGFGLCYAFTNDFKFDDSYMPCKGKPITSLHEEYRFCQTGTSAALLGKEMILGTPGPYTWGGTFFVTEIAGAYFERNIAFYHGPEYFNSPVEKYSYLGMGVTGGKYYDDNMSYASGAPRSQGHGQIITFSKNINETKSSVLKQKQIINGAQFGSGFGYELITADVNGDNLPDLLISAPFYFSKKVGGTVYIYINKELNLSDKPSFKLSGPVESRFGIAMTNMGDINKDLCDDIAIGAPYEGTGAVYIYLGHRSHGLSRKPSQIIHAVDFGLPGRSLRTFGSSLAAGSDLDDNSYPDLVVGAYESSAVVVLFTRPIVNIEANVTGVMNELTDIDAKKSGCFSDQKTNLTCFTFETCCLIGAELSLFYTIEAETFVEGNKFSRVFFPYEKKRNNIVKDYIKVKPNYKACFEITAYIKENTKDIQKSIKFQLNFTIAEQILPRSPLIGLNPILNQTQSSLVFEGKFKKDCGDKNVCRSQLNLLVGSDLEKSGNEYKLAFGEVEEFKIKANITNSADSAYEAQLFFVHDKSLTYMGAANSVLCKHFNETIVSCALGNPMNRNTSEEISIRFSSKAINDDIKMLNFTIFANSTSTLIGDYPKTSLDVKVIKYVNLGIIGEARPKEVFFGGQTKDENEMVYFDDIGKSIIHRYQVYNKGPLMAKNVQIHISLPYQLENDELEGNHLLYFESLPIVRKFDVYQSTCEILHPKMAINPLNLKLPKNNSLDVDTLTSEPYEVHPNITGKPYSYTGSESNSNDIESASIEESLKLTKRDKNQNYIVIDCAKFIGTCIKINCYLPNMLQNDEISIEVKTRLWNSTFVSKYSRYDLVKIVSKAEIVISESGNVLMVDKTRMLLETRAYPDLSNQIRISGTPWWIVIVSITCALIVLIILAAIMYICGFFKRKRPNKYAKTGNLTKNDKRKSLMNDEIVY